MISTRVEIWHDLGKDLQSQPDHIKKLFSARGDMALCPTHYLANMLDHRYLGRNVNDVQRRCVYDYLTNSVHAALIPFVVSVQHGETHPLYLFKHTFKTVVPITWWKVASETLLMHHRQQMIRLFSAVASTAGLERIFSASELCIPNCERDLAMKKLPSSHFCFGP